ALSFSIFPVFLATALAELASLSLHDALPIFELGAQFLSLGFDHILRRARDELLVLELAFLRRHEGARALQFLLEPRLFGGGVERSEEHTSELQSRENLVCRLLLEKKNKLLK